MMQSSFLLLEMPLCRRIRRFLLSQPVSKANLESKMSFQRPAFGGQAVLHLRANGYILNHIRNKTEQLVHLDKVQTVHFKNQRSGQLIARQKKDILFKDLTNRCLWFLFLVQNYTIQLAGSWLHWYTVNSLRFFSCALILGVLRGKTVCSFQNVKRCLHILYTGRLPWRCIGDS